MNDLLTLILQSTPLMLTLMVCGTIIMTMALRMMASVWTTRLEEQSRREIAAYIAEGSLTPDQGERLLRTPLRHPDAMPPI